MDFPQSILEKELILRGSLNILSTLATLPHTWRAARGPRVGHCPGLRVPKLSQLFKLKVLKKLGINTVII
jgi:hypothetical protein